MISNFSDHSANERTFLAWVRTAIAVMAFGFVVEKFNIFLQMAQASLGLHVVHGGSPRFGEVAGLGLMVMGLAMVALATLRFLKTARDIDDVERHVGPGAKVDLALAVLLFLLGIALAAYLAFTLGTR
ncbi:MAG TPA: DUF202 domain-containing protein [Caulobacteraceae bacterium]|jgi:putative membrane protein|nr:DUF202 domain-containing protein [Caulobacteraceae bacterium]